MIIISTSYEQGKAVSEKLLDANREKSYYNGAWYNCSTYVSDGLKAIFGKRIGKESILGPIKSTTPNQLWKDVLLKTSEKNLPYEVLKDPGEEVDIRFIPYIKSQLSGDSLP